MTEAATVDAYGQLIEPATLEIRRLLPGPIERIWAYLTESELRRQWLASGQMSGAGEAVELVWRNDELTDPPGQRPEGFAAEHRMTTRVLAFDPPHRLAITWGERGEVSFDLAPQGEAVLLTVIHRRLPDRDTALKVSAGWHAHLDMLGVRLRDQPTEPFWDRWSRLRAEYEDRLPA